MANMAAVNRAIRKEFPGLDIEAVRGDGYVYFCGDDGLDLVASIYAHPPVTATAEMIPMCIRNIKRATVIIAKNKPEKKNYVRTTSDRNQIQPGNSAPGQQNKRKNGQRR